jgi:hypothetical protein
MYTFSLFVFVVMCQGDEFIVSLKLGNRIYKYNVQYINTCAYSTPSILAIYVE